MVGLVGKQFRTRTVWLLRPGIPRPSSRPPPQEIAGDKWQGAKERKVRPTRWPSSYLVVYAEGTLETPFPALDLAALIRSQVLFPVLPLGLAHQAKKGFAGGLAECIPFSHDDSPVRVVFPPGRVHLGVSPCNRSGVCRMTLEALLKESMVITINSTRSDRANCRTWESFFQS